jgi:ElaB/YqjD/DUF883 family membrane-anchored ribosome-binding protein
MNTELVASRGTVASSKQTLVRDLKSVVGDAEDLLTMMGNSTAEEFAAARNRVTAKLGEVKASVDAARTAVTQQVSCAAEAGNQYVRENPWKFMGFAALAGIVAAFLVSRR